MEGEEIVPAQTNTWMLPAEKTGLWKQFSSLPILNRRSSSVKYCQAILEEDGCTEVDGQLSAAFQTLILITTFDTLTDRDFYWNSHRQLQTRRCNCLFFLRYLLVKAWHYIHANDLMKKDVGKQLSQGYRSYWLCGNFSWLENLFLQLFIDWWGLR